MDRNTHRIEKSEITSLLDFAFVLVPLRYHPDYEKWINNSSLHLIQYFEQDGLYRLSFISSWRDGHMLKKEKTLFMNSPSIMNFLSKQLIDVLIEKIDEGYYIILDLNEFYLEGKSSYKKCDFTHISFIYGYDKTEQVFKTAGYNSDGIYGSSDYSFTAIRDAFISATHHCIECIKANADFRYIYSINTLRNDLKAYLYGENLAYYFNKNVYLNYEFWAFDFGHDMTLGIYAQTTLLTLIDTHIDNRDKGEVEPLDLRNFRVVMEHKNLLFSSLEYATGKSKLPPALVYEYRHNVRDPARVAFHLGVKYNISHKIELLKRLRQLINTLMIAEKSIIKKVLASL